MSSPVTLNNQNRKPNYLYSIISVTLVLFLFGLFTMFVLHTQGLVNYYKENIEVIVELKDDAQQSEVFSFQKELAGNEFIKESSIKYVSKAEGAEFMKEFFGDDYEVADIGNPLLNVIEFNIKSDYLNSDNLDGLSASIREKPFVEEVTYHKVLVDNIVANVRKLSIVTFLVSLLFVFIAITLINNTVKLTLYSNRFLIKNMELVGATKEFITRPYVIKGISNGFISGLIAVVAIILVTFVFQRQMPELVGFRTTIGYIVLVFSILLLGIAISGISTFQSVRKHLQTSLDDLY